MHRTMLRLSARATAIDGAAKKASHLVGRALKGGRLKDVLSGTPLGHPAHPMLTDVTVGAWTAATLLDLSRREDAHRAADTLVGTGVVAALPTAATGLSDWSDTSDDALRIGAIHAIGNTTATLLYGASWVLRKTGRRRAGMAVGLLGGLAATAAGYLGGHLSYRKGVGVDHTIFEQRPDDWVAVAESSALHSGKPLHARAHGQEVVIVADGGDVYAVADRCSHRGGPLHQGDVEEGTITCPWHGSCFSLKDGSVLSGPATAPQPTYEARIHNGQIEVRATT